MRIPIFTDEVGQNGGWQGAQLAQAFKVRGVEVVFVSLQDCLISLASDNLKDKNTQIRIPGFAENPPAAFVRGIAGGTLQQVITRINILHMLAMQCVKIYNDGRAIERTVDKGMTSFLLHQHGIAIPQTWVCESRNQAHSIIQEQVSSKKKLVLKPLFGSQGRGLQLLDAASKLPLPMDKHVDGVFYLQQFVESGAQNHDFRVFVINNHAVAAMRRSGNGWLNNVAQGAHCEEAKDTDILALAEQAAKAVDIEYCGVDIIRDKDGKLWVLEVNSIPAWHGLQSATKVNVAQLLVDDFLSKI